MKRTTGIAAALLVPFAASSAFSAVVLLTNSSRQVAAVNSSDSQGDQDGTFNPGPYDAAANPADGTGPNFTTAAFASQHTHLDVTDNSLSFTGSAEADTFNQVTGLPPTFIFSSSLSDATINFSLTEPATYTLAGSFGLTPPSSLGDCEAELQLSDSKGLVTTIGYSGGFYTPGAVGVLEPGDYTLQLLIDSQCHGLQTSIGNPAITDDRGASVTNLSVLIAPFTVPEPTGLTLMAALGVFALGFRRSPARSR